MGAVGGAGAAGASGASGAEAGAGVTLQLHLYNLTRDPKLTCNDGTPGGNGGGGGGGGGAHIEHYPGYYYREATAPEYDHMWIFYLEVS